MKTISPDSEKEGKREEEETVGSALSPWQDKLSAHPASSRDL
jgi:hypothetical protein